MKRRGSKIQKAYVTLNMDKVDERGRPEATVRPKSLSLRVSPVNLKISFEIIKNGVTIPIGGLHLKK